ncbi:L-threonine dehydratase catabolic TdcB [Oceanobacillus oncorhynchi]|uniref:threonine ammonia-lyase n=1 Tax=Oceanobacillus oncorhynchi TaxID=545501 RepID=A0A0A1M5C0_9BACI|nr:threonine/serine dehydratase [Oceanobacillus oncorhynchi]CEI80490.1 L-threonine dehydratase catabolic TdcB [Oceanobacillus oncorhynchi]
MLGQSLENPTINDIKKAETRIKKYVDVSTKVITSEILNMKYGFPIYIKPEGLQPTGSFKIRGALNKILKAKEDGQVSHCITASAGNHAISLASSSLLLGLKSTVVMSEQTPQIKILTCERLGAEVIIHGENYDEAYKEAQKISSEKNYYYIHPVADCEIVAGQGTIGLEILEEMPDIDQVIVPIGGGGLISGIAIALKSLKPEMKVIGVQPEKSNAYYKSWKRSYLVNIEKPNTIADGLSLKQPEKYLFNMMKHWVDDIVTVKEDTIEKAIKEFLFLGKLLIEGAGAVTLASIIESKINIEKKTVLIGSGSNIDEQRFKALLN